MALKKSHNDRGCYVIRKVRHNLYRTPAILFFCKRHNVDLQYILVNYRHIVISRKCLLKDRDKVGVNLHRRNLTRILAQKLCHGSDSRPYLKDKIILRHACLTDYLLDNITINEKVLPETLLEHETIFVYYLSCVCWISKMFVFQVFPLSIFIIRKCTSKITQRTAVTH